MPPAATRRASSEEPLTSAVLRATSATVALICSAEAARVWDWQEASSLLAAIWTVVEDKRVTLVARSSLEADTRATRWRTLSTKVLNQWARRSNSSTCNAMDFW